MSWDNIKKSDVVMYKINNQELRGIALDVALTEEGTYLFVVNIDSNMLDAVPYMSVKLLRKLKDFDKENMMPINEFIECVESGCITDYDGTGYYSDGEYKYDYVCFDPSVLKEKAKKYQYICWYNK